MDIVTGSFKDDGYRLVDTEIPLEGQVFYTDTHCVDVLVFPPDSRDFIQEHELFQKGHIVMQVRGQFPNDLLTSPGFSVSAVQDLGKHC